MSDASIQDSANAPVHKSRKPYHTPQIEDYGAVSELTRSGPYTGFPNYDGLGGYGSPV